MVYPPIYKTSLAKVSRLLADVKGGGVRFDVISPPPGELFKEINDNSAGILLSSGTARVLLAGGDVEKKAEEYMSNGPYVGPLAVVTGAP